MVFLDVTPLAAHQHTLSFHLNWSFPGILAIVAGVLSFVRPKNINQIVAGYLVVLGLYEVFGVGF